MARPPWTGCGRAQAPDPRAHRQRARSRQPVPRDQPLAGYGSDYTLGGGMVVGIGVIAGTECVVMGNDPSVLGGALTPYVQEVDAAIEIARDNRIPYVSFVESAGADLRVQTGGASRRRVQTDHFAESGRPFYEMIELSKQGIPTVCVVFVVHGRRRLPAGAVGLRDRRRGAVEDLPGRPTAGEDGDRRGERRRDAGRRPPPRRGVRAGRLLRHRRDGRHPHVSRGGLAPQLAQTRAREPAPVPTPRSMTPRSCWGWSAAICGSPSTCATSSPGWWTAPASRSSSRATAPPWCAGGRTSTATPWGSSATTG